MAARASGTALALRPKALYRYLLRRAEALPGDAREHYKHRIRQVGERQASKCLFSLYLSSHAQEFTSYADETDPERVREIVAMAVKDAEWVLQKVRNFV